jgi:DNA-binding LacI/PurR family transcriptional regulator
MLRQLAATAPEGGKLPSERELAIEFCCSSLTVHKAFGRLVRDGVVTRRIGSGTFVPKQCNPDRIRATDLKRIRVGVFVFKEESAHAFSVLHAILRQASVQSIDLQCCWASDFSVDDLRQAEALREAGCVALALPWFPAATVGKIRSFVDQCALPVSFSTGLSETHEILFANLASGSSTSAGIEAIVRYFVNLGHSRIAFLGPESPNDLVLQQKLGVYASAVTRERLPALYGLVAPGNRSMDQLAGQWKKFRGQLAIICYDDEHALRFMSAMHKLRYSAPSDYCIVGYNNIDAGRYSDPPLSTIAPNFDDVAGRLLRNALSLSKKEALEFQGDSKLSFFPRLSCGGSGRITPEMIRDFGKSKIGVMQSWNPTGE